MRKCNRFVQWCSFARGLRPRAKLHPGLHLHVIVSSRPDEVHMQANQWSMSSHSVLWFSCASTTASFSGVALRAAFGRAQSYTLDCTCMSLSIPAATKCTCKHSVLAPESTLASLLSHSLRSHLWILVRCKDVGAFCKSVCQGQHLYR